MPNCYLVDPALAKQHISTLIRKEKKDNPKLHKLNEEIWDYFCFTEGSYLTDSFFETVEIELEVDTDSIVLLLSLMEREQFVEKVYFDTKKVLRCKVEISKDEVIAQMRTIVDDSYWDKWQATIYNSWKPITPTLSHSFFVEVVVCYIANKINPISK